LNRPIEIINNNFYKNKNNNRLSSNFKEEFTLVSILFFKLELKSMKKMYHYATVEKALEELKAKGYTIDFNIEEDQILRNPSHFAIVEIYRYEGMSNPDDEATVYGINNKENGSKGVFVAGNLAFAESDVAKILLKLEIDDKKNED